MFAVVGMVSAVGLMAPAASAAPVARPVSASNHITIAMPTPQSPAAITTDDQAISWGLKHMGAAELRDMASGLNVRMPADGYFGPAQCQGGSAVTSVWVINFSKTNVNWNVMVDGRVFATATSPAQTHGIASMDVPAGKHTLKLVNAGSGKASDAKAINLTCGVGAAVKPGTTKPSTPAPSKPAAQPGKHDVTPAKPSTPSSTQTSTSTPATAAPAAGTHSKAEGPRVEADYVAKSTSKASGFLAAGVGAVLGGLVLLFSGRMRRQH